MPKELPNRNSLELIPPTDAKFLIQVTMQFADDFELYLEDGKLCQEPDIDQTTISALEGIATGEQAFHTLMRLYALQAYTVRHASVLKPWLVTDPSDSRHRLISGALFEAAARAPLYVTGVRVSSLRFDVARFEAILLEETEADGSA